jgi:hypothetical protein
MFVFYRRGGVGGRGRGAKGEAIDFYSLHMCLGLSLSVALKCLLARDSGKLM